MNTDFKALPPASYSGLAESKEPDSANGIKKKFHNRLSNPAICQRKNY